MGRTDEVQFMLECVAEWRRLGARVTFEPGWETRGNGLNGNYEGGEVHHTASNSSAANPNPTRNTLIHGRPDLPGPLCNVTGPWCTDADPWLHVIAAFPSNNAGASGGKSMGPLPKTSLFNPIVIGLEIDYPGSSPMTGGQRRAALIFTRGLTNVLKRSPEYVRAHAETSITGKWDPGFAPGKTIDMAAFRKEAANLTGADMPLNQADIDIIKNLLRTEIIDRYISNDGAGHDLQLWQTINLIKDRQLGYGNRIEDTQARVIDLQTALVKSSAEIKAAVSAAIVDAGDVDVSALTERVVSAVAAALSGMKISVTR